MILSIVVAKQRMLDIEFYGNAGYCNHMRQNYQQGIHVPERIRDGIGANFRYQWKQIEYEGNVDKNEEHDEESRDCFFSASMFSAI